MRGHPSTKTKSKCKHIPIPMNRAETRTKLRLKLSDTMTLGVRANTRILSQDGSWCKVRSEVVMLDVAAIKFKHLNKDSSVAIMIRARHWGVEG
jgi:hypothetical protein